MLAYVAVDGAHFTPLVNLDGGADLVEQPHLLFVEDAVLMRHEVLLLVLVRHILMHIDGVVALAEDALGVWALVRFLIQCVSPHEVCPPNDDFEDKECVLRVHVDVLGPAPQYRTRGKLLILLGELHVEAMLDLELFLGVLGTHPTLNGCLLMVILQQVARVAELVHGEALQGAINHAQ